MTKTSRLFKEILKDENSNNEQILKIIKNNN